MRSLAIYCADIGSIQRGNFAWARGERRARIKITDTGKDIAGLAERIVLDFDAGHPVALGFECPLFLPVRNDPDRLTCCREGEGDRPWSAGAGAQVLVTGLAETIWILRTIRRPGIRPFLGWGAFYKAGAGVFFWEAFVTGEAKSGSHIGDAKVGVRAFAEQLPSEVVSLSKEEDVHSLIGAALLRTEWSTDLSLLKTPCVVIAA